MAIPANLFLYQFADMPLVWFGVLPIDDIEEFQAFIHRQDEWVYESGEPFSRLVSDHMLALHNADQVAVAFLWGPRGQAVVMETHLQDLLRGNHQVSLTISRFKELKNRSGHVNVMGEQSLRVDFQRGAIAFVAGAAPENVAFPNELKEGITGFVQMPD